MVSTPRQRHYNRTGGEFVGQGSGLLTPSSAGSRSAPVRAQRGFGGFFLIVLVAGMTAAAGLFTFYRTDPVEARSARVTTDVLAEVKAALIGYAVRQGGPTGTARPGDLPCPDVDGDGIEGSAAQMLLPPVTCAAGAVGQIPWRTLGIPEPKDSAGETLWYAVSGRFRARSAGNNSALNSDTRGDLVVRTPAPGGGFTDLTSSAVAVIIAPGGAIGGQSRRGTGGGVVCGLLGTILPKFCPTNYLDAYVSGGSTINNVPATATGPFVAAPATASFNDRVMYLSADEIMPALEMRVGAELTTLLQKYRENSSCKCYPWADNWPHASGIADTGQNRGTFPRQAFPEEWHEVGLALPSWLENNEWHNLFWYSVGRQNTDQTASSSRRCKTCSDHPLLKVTNTVNNEWKWVSALIITPGPPLDGVARLTQSSRINNINWYFEDTENRDGANSSICRDVGEIGDGTPSSWINYEGALSCDEYVVPRSKAMNRDRIFMTAVADPVICSTNAQVLLDMTCHLTGNQVKPECMTAVRNLDACPCLEGAREMLEEPCRNNHSSSQCKAPLTQLQICAKM